MTERRHAMIKKQTNHELITASLIDLLHNSKSLSAITVQDITDNCGISRRTFYNTFKDKYDIVTQLYLDILYSGDHDPYADYYSFLVGTCKDIECDKQVWKSIIRDPVSCQYLERISCEFQINRFEADSSMNINSYEKSLLRFYSLGFFRTISDWILSGCQMTAEQIARVLSSAVPIALQGFFGLNDSIMITAI